MCYTNFHRNLLSSIKMLYIFLYILSRKLYFLFGERGGGSYNSRLLNKLLRILYII